MSEVKNISIVCEECGKEIEIPADIKEFSCVYCGKKMILENLTYCGNVDELTESIEYCITDFRDIMGSFSRTDYADTFKSYMERCRSTFTRLDGNVAKYPAHRDEILQKTAERFIKELKEAWEADIRWKSKLKRTMLQEDDKLTLAIYMVPMIKELGLSISNDLAEKIHDEWERNYPKSQFMVGEYTQINDSFRKKIFGICYITTAVCEFENKPDDCRELTVLRNFRDGYLMQQPDGEALIKEYYENAPAIVTMMDLTENRERCYTELRDKYILPCVEDAEAGRYEQCKNRYVDMMKKLEKKYGFKA